MKSIIILSVFFIVANSYLLNLGSWTATSNNQFSNMSFDEKKQYLGALRHPFNASDEPLVNLPDKDVPDNFDARYQWPTCIHPIRNQQSCGSCWAFSASEAFSDRVCIATNGAINVVLSPEDLVSCDTSNFGCSGGYLDEAWNFIASTGIVSDDCFPYSAGSGIAPACTNTCSNGQKWLAYKATNIRSLTISAAKQTISTQGPIQTAFAVYNDFFSYSNGIYVQKSTQLAGYHAVKVAGWGHDEASGLDYWLAANSWGTTWGESGYFKIAFGESEFDSNFIVGDYSGTTAGDIFLQ